MSEKRRDKPPPPSSEDRSAPDEFQSIELLRRARRGDAVAMDRLFARYMARLQCWARGRLPAGCRDLMDTDDIVQETLLRTIRHVGHFNSQGPGFLAYLRTAVQNRIRDEIRRQTRRPFHREIQDHTRARGPSPLEETMGREAVRRYEAALASLKDEEREAILMRIEMDLPYQEIADALGLGSADTARMRVTRGLVRLAREMGHEA
jgi:RNA polymerase sigma-70 factor (ECF subfamily)